MGALDRAREIAREGAKPDVSAETSSLAAEPSPDLPRPSRVDAVIALAESYLAGNVGSSNGGERFAVMVHVDQEPLAPNGVLAGTLVAPVDDLARPADRDPVYSRHGAAAGSRPIVGQEPLR